MGLEQTCPARWPGGSGEVKALLETHELILRGDFRRTFPIASLTDVRVEEHDLLFKMAADDIALTLGAEKAGRWAKKLTTLPPALAQKLGLGPSSPALVIGQIHDPVLLAALDGHTTPSPEEAHLCLAIAEDEAALAHALATHQRVGAETPIWIVNVKGRHSPLGDNAIRRVMRDAGYRDNKISAVSETLSATRYARQK